MKQKILEYCNTIIGDYDQEEIDNFLEILEEYDNELTNLTELDAKILIRLIDDEDLVGEINNCIKVSNNNDNPFG